ncbi:MAG TPA: hypothetical protein DCK95_02055 [Anaerolineaceae bacterium]|nr:hypothetical protein [Anaerolineaceae bacterium]
MLMTACNFPLSQDNNFDDRVSTQAALAFTQTAMQNQYAISTITLQPTSSAPTVTPTSEHANPKNDLGNATWTDPINSGSSFGLGNDVETIEGTNASVWVENGAFHLYRSSASGGYIWYCSYPNISDFYLEAKFTVQNCNGSDEYGLTFRKPDFGDKTGYYFAVTCDGTFNLMRWINGDSTLLGEWTSSDLFNKGTDATNTLGVWAEGNLFKLYINDQFAAEFTDKSAIRSGYFGLYSNPQQTAGLTVLMDEVSYWNLP